jgi:signal transduction histidine kinase
VTTRRWTRVDLLVAAGLAVFVAGTYLVVAVVAGDVLFGRRDAPRLGLSVLATAVVAVGFNPVQAWLERVARNMLGRTSPSPYEVLRQCSTAVTVDDEEVLARTSRLVAQASAASWAQVWLLVGDELRLAAAWPAGAGAPAPPEPADGLVDASGAGLRCVAVREGGRLVGVVRLAEGEQGALTPAEERLLQSVAAQASLVLRTIRLQTELSQRFADLTAYAAELQESRERVIAAQDEERRRLERDIHDGAQQHLVALAVNLRLAQTIIARSPTTAPAVLVAQSRAARDAATAVADLSQGIYPRRLREDGLIAALSTHLAGGALAVELSGHELGPLPSEVEIALYFCCMEAVQNAAKHASASRVAVELSSTTGTVRLSIVDDGVGFGDEAARGTGLLNMQDRVDAVGGRLALQSAPSRGTRVNITVPVPV